MTLIETAYNEICHHIWCIIVLLTFYASLHALQTDHNSFTYARVVDEVLEQQCLLKGTASWLPEESEHDQEEEDQLDPLENDTLENDDSPFMEQGPLLEAIREALAV